MPTLINRLTPYPLESLSSFMERLRQANYYEEPHWYLDLLPSRLSEPLDHLSSDEQYAALAELTGLTETMLYNMTIHRLLPAFQSLNANKIQGRLNRPFWIHGGISTYIHAHRTGKICPLCWREMGIAFVPWLARHVTTCRFHRVLLVDICPTCVKPLQTDRSRGICRGCLTPLSELPAISLRGHAVSSAVTSLVWSALGCSYPFPPMLTHLPQAHPIYTMKQQHFLEFLWNGYHLLKTYDPGNPIFNPELLLPGTTWKRPPDDLRSASVSEVHGAMTAMWRLLLDWPQAWDVTLERVLRRNVSLNSRAFPSALATTFNGDEWLWLHQSWADFVRRVMHINPRIVSWLRYYRGMQQGRLPIVAPPLLSQREAARELNVSEEQLKKFVEQGLLRANPPSELPSQRSWQLIDAESVQELRAVRAKHLTLGQTAMLIGASEEQVVALVGAGLLIALTGPLVDKKGIWRFDPTVVQAGMEQLLGNVPIKVLPVPRVGVQSLAEVQRTLTRYQKRLPHILLDIQHGALPMYRVADDLALTALWCEEVSLRQYQKEIQRTVFELLSVDAVCKRLGCKPLTLRHLYGAGLLVPINDDTNLQGVRHHYAEEDVATFMERYITSDQAAALLGVTQVTIQSWTRTGRLIALTGPELDGSKAYRFDKAALIRWRHERLTVGETMKMLGVSKATLHRWAKQGKLRPLEDMGGKQRWFLRKDVEQFSLLITRHNSIEGER